MKKIFLVLGLGALLFSQSCSYDDKSTTADELIPAITIWIPADDDPEADNYAKTRLYANFGDSIEFAPEIRCEGCTEEDFECEWTMSIATYALNQVDKDNFEVLGHEPVLRWRVNRDPATQTYGFRLRVKNKKTGVYYQRSWGLIVNAVSKQGLMVADSKDGQTSDLHIIQDEPFFKSGYQGWDPEVNKPQRFNNVFSQANGKNFPGIILGMKFRTTPYMGKVKNFVKMFSKDNLCDIFTLDFKIHKIGLEDFFYDVPKNPNFQAMFTYNYQNYTEYLVNNYSLQSRACETNKDMVPIKYSIANSGSPVSCEATGIEPTSKISPYYSDAVFCGLFDEYKQKLLFWVAQSWQAYSAFTYIKDITAVAGNFECIGAGNADAAKLFVLRETTTGEIYYFTVGNTGSSQRAVNISDAPDIQNAKFFLPVPSQKELLYIANSKLYSVVCQTGMPAVYKELYTFPGEVTVMKIMTSNNITIPNSNKAFVVATSTGQTNGTIYYIPLGLANSGDIDTENIKIYEGFNRISAVANVD